MSPEERIRALEEELRREKNERLVESMNAQQTLRTHIDTIARLKNQLAEQTNRYFGSQRSGSSYEGYTGDPTT